MKFNFTGKFKFNVETVMMVPVPATCAAWHLPAAAALPRAGPYRPVRLPCPTSVTQAARPLRLALAVLPLAVYWPRAVPVAPLPGASATGTKARCQ